MHIVKQISAKIIPAGYVIDVASSKPSFACKMYVHDTTDMNSAGINDIR